MDLEHGAAEHHVPGHLRFGGLTVPEPEFAEDDGSADPGLAAALVAYERGEAHDADLLAALRGRRLMVPLLAVLDEAEDVDPAHGDGPPRPGEKDSHMASVSLVSADGRRGLLAFTSVAAMAAWDPAARGIPSTAEKVAAAALEEGADAVLLDLGGPVRHALTGVPLRAVAAGHDLPEPVDDPDVRDAVVRVLERSDGVVRADLHPGPAGPDGLPAADLLLLVGPAEGRDSAAVAGAVAEAVGGDPLLARRCPRGVAVAVLPG